MARKHSNPRTQAGRAIWKNLERIIHRGHSTSNVFTDWLDLMLYTHLALTAYIDITKPSERDLLKIDNAHNDAYLNIVGKYPNKEEKGNREIDYFTAAYAELRRCVEVENEDALSDVYQSCISFGEHGQFFTPSQIGAAMAKITGIQDREWVLDPACGSGTLLLEAAKMNRTAYLVGMDLDERCAKMCAINLFLRELSGCVVWGNTLTGEAFKEWRITYGWIRQTDEPEVWWLAKPEPPAEQLAIGI